MSMQLALLLFVLSSPPGLWSCDVWSFFCFCASVWCLARRVFLPFPSVFGSSCLRPLQVWWSSSCRLGKQWPQTSSTEGGA